MNLSILRLDDPIDLVLSLGRGCPMPSCVLLSYSETRDSHVLRDIIDHKSHEPRVRRKRNDQRSENE